MREETSPAEAALHTSPAAITCSFRKEITGINGNMDQMPLLKKRVGGIKEM
jgi:hypothetical protein